MFFRQRFFNFFSVISLSFGLSVGTFGADSKIAESKLKGKIRKVCGNLLVTSIDEIEFTDNEKILLCGDSETEEWANVPRWQQKLYLTPILQSKGRHDLKFNDNESDKTEVVVGPPTRVKKIEFFNFPESTAARGERIRKPTFDEFIGRRLRGTLLDEIEELTKVYLSFYGYPCVEVNTTASVQTKTVKIRLSRVASDADLKLFPEISETEQDKVYVEAIKRSYPFDQNEVFDQRLLDIATKRLRQQGLLNYSRFEKSCKKEDEFTIRHHMELLKPRIVRLGVGFDTEQGPLFLAAWKNSRLSKLGSSFETKLETSFVQQELDLKYKWYPHQKLPKLFLQSNITLTHEKEDAFEQNTIELGFNPSYESDVGRWGYSVSIGPELNYVDLIRGSGDTSENYIVLATSISAWTHKFEYFETNPNSGLSANFLIEHTDENWGLGIEASKLTLNFTAMENFGDPIFENFVLGLRGLLSTTIINESADVNKLPADLKIFLGGSQNFRGFGRKELPFSGEGSLTAAYLGTEARWNNFLPAGFQPLIFVDGVSFSNQSATLDDAESFWAPGLGFRWQSPIGAFRLTVARAIGIDSGNKDLRNSQIYFSFGEEF